MFHYPRVPLRKIHESLHWLAFNQKIAALLDVRKDNFLPVLAAMVVDDFSSLGIADRLKFWLCSVLLGAFCCLSASCFLCFGFLLVQKKEVHTLLILEEKSYFF